MSIQINEPYLNIVDLKTIHEATINISSTGSITIDQLRKHIDALQKALLELEYVNKTRTQQIKQERGFE
jgi:hypothetical protein